MFVRAGAIFIQGSAIFIAGPVRFIPGAAPFTPGAFIFTPRAVPWTAGADVFTPRGITFTPRDFAFSVRDIAFTARVVSFNPDAIAFIGGRCLITRGAGRCKPARRHPFPPSPTAARARRVSPVGRLFNAEQRIRKTECYYRQLRPAAPAPRRSCAPDPTNPSERYVAPRSV